MTGVMEVRGWSETGYADVADVVRTRTGLAFTASRCHTAEAGIRRAMARRGVSSLVQYRRVLDADVHAFDELIAELTVGETYFFRDPQHFSFIRERVLPEIVRGQGDAHVIHAWSAGCATGEEAYSLAVVLVEEGFGERAVVRASDISPAALATARSAVYGAWSLREPGASAIRPYLRPLGERYALDERIRRLVTFERLNLALDAGPSFASGLRAMDLILCRNVLIYFEREAIRRVAMRLFESLADGGWLITGPSDPPLADDAPYETVVSAEGVFYRRPRATAPTHFHLVPPPVVPLRPAPPAAPSRPPGGEDPSAVSETLAAARLALAEGDYDRVVRLTRDVQASPAAVALRVRALANVDTLSAERVCADALTRHALAPELHYLRAVLLTDLGRQQDAVRAVGRALYLDPSLAAAHFILGTLLRLQGDLEGARRAYRNARDLCASLPPDEVVPLADGERAGRLAEAAEAQVVSLDTPRGAA